MGGNHHKGHEDKWIVDEILDLEREYEREIEEAEEMAKNIIQRAQEKALKIIQSAEEEGVELIKAYTVSGRIKGEKEGERIIEEAKRLLENLRSKREEKVEAIAKALVKRVLGE
jgi:vacuolar-type H+-ATPase subunit H